LLELALKAFLQRSQNVLRAFLEPAPKASFLVQTEYEFHTTSFATAILARISPQVNKSNAQ